MLSNEENDFEERINKNWRLSDIELRFRPTHRDFKELVSERVFISSNIESVIRSEFTNSESIISYLINDIKKGNVMLKKEIQC